jgi:sugar-specific transcriptional regulator TrmB
MAPADLSRRTSIPSGRVYDVLESLDKKGFVRNLGGRPASYDAEHPRSIVSSQIQKMQELAEDDLDEAEEAWEVRHDQRQVELGNKWIVSGYAGFAHEVKTCLADAQKSVIIFDPDLTWIRGGDAFAMKEALARGVEIDALTSERSVEHVKGFRIGELAIRALEHRSEAFYVFDEKRVLVRLQSPEGAVVFDSEALAQILVNHHTRLEKGGRQVK